jgi:apolipoprotein N-acyltransferase
METGTTPVLCWSRIHQAAGIPILHHRLEGCGATLAFPDFFAKLAALKNLVSQILLRSRYPFAIAAGLVLAASLPKLSIAGFAWIAPALILAAAHNRTGGDAFRIGYMAGLAQHLASLYWLLLIPVTGYPILGWVALSAYVALYPAIWVWLLSGKIGTGGWGQRTAWSLAGAAIWVALEMILGHLFSGFPWNVLGSSQYQLLPLIQIASVTGVYGVSFLVVWTSLALFSAGHAILRQPTNRQVWLSEIILPLVVLVGVFMFGFARLREQNPDSPTIRVTFIQPSIPQKWIWASGEDSSWFVRVLDLTRRALTNDTDLVLWPEAAIPHRIRYDEDTRNAVTGIAKSNRVWMIIGSDDTEPRVGSLDPAEADDFNCSFLVSADGTLVSRYCKRNLVIFGEYIPLVRWLPFVKWFTPISSGFTPGDKVVPFELSNLKAKVTTLICFEDMFPHLARGYVEADTDFLVNLTNDGWFGESAEQWQHAAGAVFRAVENGLPLARCCNNGVTCWVDSRGRIREIFRDENGSVYGAGFMTARIPVLAPGETRTPTFYNRHGDWFGWACVGIGGVVVLARIRKGLLARRSAAADSR